MTAGTFFKIKSITVLLLLAGVCSSGHCADGFHSLDEFGEWITFYYLHPQPDQVPHAVRYFSDSALYGTSSTMPVVAFFASVLEKDETALKRVYQEISADGSDNSRMVLLNALKLINSEASRAMLGDAKDKWQSPRLQTVADGGLQHPFKPLLTVDVDSPMILDMLWSAFFATGDEKPVLRILSALDSPDPVVSGAAQWSLASNAQRHPIVRQICQKASSESAGERKAVLEDILKSKQP